MCKTPRPFIQPTNLTSNTSALRALRQASLYSIQILSDSFALSAVWSQSPDLRPQLAFLASAVASRWRINSEMPRRMEGRWQRVAAQSADLPSSSS
eukprot:COSAG06_NODE_306_length_17801_cov_6.989210_11_plen_96_part_00